MHNVLEITPILSYVKVPLLIINLLKFLQIYYIYQNNAIKLRLFFTFA